MDKLIVIKNGLVVTLDRNKSAGFFNIVIRNGKISLVDKDKKFSEKEFLIKYPDAEIIDAQDKLVFPGFFNSRLVSSYSFNKVFFKKCSYENINSWVSLKSIDRFLSSNENSDFVYDLLNISYAVSLLNGELFISENSKSFPEEFINKNFADRNWIKQYFNLVFFDYTLIPENIPDEKFISVGFKTDDEINNYSLSSMKKAAGDKSMKLFIEASLSSKTFEAVKKDFGKRFINVLADMEMISSNSVIVNPVILNSSEIEFLKKKNAYVLICPSDYLNLSDKKPDLDELLMSGIKIMIGTGLTGNNILAELKTLSLMLGKGIMKFESLIKTAILYPSFFFGVSNLTGSIERNKSADFVLFNLDDLRNRLTMPELNQELLCEFMINNLSVNDISDVFIKGEKAVCENKIVNVSDTVNPNRLTEIANRIYKEGKYFEFKEKYLMRSRVDSINLENKELEDVKPEIFVDYTDTTEIYLGEGEFTIKGKKEEDFEKERKEVKTGDVMPKEISSLEDDLNLLEDLEEEQDALTEFQTSKESDPAGKISKELKEKSLKIKIDSGKTEEISEHTDSVLTEKTHGEKTQEESEKEKTVFKKSKLQFGFGDEGKKKPDL
ncbi:MAG: 5'-deoxyadenosine deaminase [Ignavibacteria bacterium]|nr:5'-deoxyadenosine deaminase [Ignavibacteria bacterium]